MFQDLTARQVLNVDATRAIAGEVARRVHSNASVAFSVDKTPQMVAEGLANHSGLKIFTNNLNVALIASANPTFETFIAGGQIRSTDLDVVGSNAAEFFSSCKVDYGLYGVDWSIISAATLLSVAPLLVAFLPFQRQFVQSFMTAGIK